MKIINGQKVNEVAIFNNEKEIQVNISVDAYKDTGTIVRLTTKDIIPYLNNDRGIEVGECIKSSVVSNMSENSQFGTWVFKKPTSGIEILPELKTLIKEEIKEEILIENKVKKKIKIKDEVIENTKE